jgi:Zn-dependent protease with chaperone function
VRSARRVAIACLLLVLTVAPLASAQGEPEPPGRDPAFEQEIYDRLAEIESEAVPIFQEATEAMDAGDLTAALQGYERVLSLAPGFPDAARRLSYVEMELGLVKDALRHARSALTTDPSPYNEMALARVLLATEERDDAAEALTHAQAAVEALPEDPEARSVLLYAAIVTEDVDLIRKSSAKLVELDPDLAVGHYFAGLLAAEDGRWEEAERELLLARELGMPAEPVEEALDAGIRSRARTRRWLRRGGYVIGGWLVGLPVLLGVGAVLSKLTLTTVRDTRPTADFEVGRGERVVRTLYRIVIGISSLYFYLSVPLLILIVVAATGGIFYLFYLGGSLPLRLLAIIGAAAIYTLYAIVRSVFTRVEEGEPGRPLPRGEAPRLWSLTEEVADEVGVRPVDAIYVTPAPSIAVTERGSIWKKLRGAGRRYLILGLGALPGMSQGQLKAILAHEYGHFSNRDTAGGNLARRVRVSMNRMAYGLAVSGQARWYNPAWLFVRGFNRIFLRITLGASRLQEILADRYAAATYGVQTFIGGLRHIIRQSLAFNAQVAHEVKAAQTEGRDLRNLYALPPLEDDEQIRQLREKEGEVMGRPTSPYDSHPAPRERLALLEQMDAINCAAGGAAPVWDLLPNGESLQEEMTVVVEENVRQRRGQSRQAG